MQDHARSDDDDRNILVPENIYQVPTTKLCSGSYCIKGKERQSQDFYFEESLDGDKSRDKQTPLQEYEEIETDEDKILNPEVPTTSPRRSGLRYEGLLKQHLPRDFDTVSELKQWAQDWAWSQGFALSQDQLKEHHVQEKQAECMRTNLWSLCPRWIQNTLNHEPAPAISGLSTHRRFDHKELEMIHNLCAVGTPPKQILSTLKKTREHINESDTVRAQRSGKIPLEHLYHELIRSNYLYESKKDSNNTLTDLFFAHPERIWALTGGVRALIRTRAAEFISLFIDDKLKKGLKGKTDEEIEDQLEKTFSLYRHLNKKDLFEKYYKNHLAKRLLFVKSISEDTEQNMIIKLKLVGAWLGRAGSWGRQGLDPGADRADSAGRGLAQQGRVLGLVGKVGQAGAWLGWALGLVGRTGRGLAWLGPGAGDEIRTKLRLALKFDDNS
ncbi:Cullin family-domain-containing protein [Phakopsora pachyrhizi]|nr:Cullin family-domain-containing protein [Phakopsora pachyrhizi]